MAVCELFDVTATQDDFRDPYPLAGAKTCKPPHGLARHVKWFGAPDHVT